MGPDPHTEPRLRIRFVRADHNPPRPDCHSSPIDACRIWRGSFLAVDRWELEARRLVGKRISELRRGKNWTQEDLAEAAGLHRTYVADIERGARNPSMASLVRLAGALGARMGDLFPDEVVTLAGRAPRP